MSNDASDRVEDAPNESVAERLSERVQEWAHPHPEHQVAGAGASTFSAAHVPYGVDLAAAWAWRLIVIGGATYALFRGLEFFAELTVPVVVALLISALGSPAVAWLRRLGLPRGAAAGLFVLALIAIVAAMLSLAGQQVANGANDLANQVSAGLGEIRHWLKAGPLHATDSQINDYIAKAQDSLSKKAQDGAVLSQVTDLGSALGHLLAGLFIVLFSTYFFLADGDRIWAWFVRLAPRAARSRVDSSGRVAWVSLTQFVRATVIVAFTDAVGVMIWASVLRVPFVFAIGVVVFLGAFVPIVGAFFAGTVAVLVALVDHGPVSALLMLLGVVVVQQIESHVLQPFLMGRFVSVHPLGVIIAIAAGILVAGVAGALIAVPFAAAANAVVQHLAGQTTVGDDAKEALETDYVESGEQVPVPEARADDDDGAVGDTDQAGVADVHDEEPDD